MKSTMIIYHYQESDGQMLHIKRMRKKFTFENQGQNL